MDTEIKAGDDVAFRIIPGYEFAPAKVVSITDSSEERTETNPRTPPKV